MSVSIDKINIASDGEWDDTWENCDYATYFHSREWAGIWHKYTQGKITPAPRRITFSDGIIAILPVSVLKSFKGIFQKFLLSPAGTFGGWISKDKIGVEHSQSILDYILNNWANLNWHINPYDETIQQCNFHGYPLRNDKTQLLDLSYGFSCIQKKWTKGHSSAARKARKEGVTIKLADDLQDWEAYYKIYEDSLQRWGDTVSSVYKWALFKEIFQRNSKNVRLWLSVYKGIPVAGALCFYSKKHVVYWHGAASEKYFKLRPVNLLVAEIIQDSCESGCKWFDFNPSGEHEGVKRFKKSFGAKSVLCPTIINETRPYMFANKSFNFIKQLMG